MQDTPNAMETPMLGLAKDDWLLRLDEIVDEDGYLLSLGDRHWAAFIEDKPTLLVTFESLQAIQDRGDTGQPLGFELVRELGWSQLAFLSDGDTWFRDPAVFAFVDRLADDGFFDEFDRVLFYGAGPGGYAAAAFSVAAPGATVVAVEPQATLDPQLVPWEDRFPQMRRVSFTSRYGYAPRMVEAAERAFVLYDPHSERDAVHAALFARDHVELLKTPLLGGDPGGGLETHLLDTQILFRLLVKAAAGKMSPTAFHQMWRARRNYGPYLRRLLQRTEDANRPFLTALLCSNVTRRMNAPMFRRKLKRLIGKAA
ncbi:phosphoadenosine phosphosulfate reductase [Shimia biformata]|uniref:phosphoadenosine phosphosulfate reductase n=1 Tax=Shimia biformata TaxID=1294299 RepID=UPI0019504BA8|nr:phosphoadenosine phosphosulfate reductase [Shimia biformata]